MTGRVVPLECGHGFRVPDRGLPPRPGTYVECRGGCGRPRRVSARRAGPPVYVQDRLL